MHIIADPYYSFYWRYIYLLLIALSLAAYCNKYLPFIMNICITDKHLGQILVV